jgi:acetyltransferase-like isoleucine patch superfamily enzyme
MKGFLVSLFMPWTCIFLRLQGLRRVWAFSSLQAGMARHLDRSVVVLGPPELQGSCNIFFGRNLMLYRDIYLETQAHGEIKIDDDVVISRGVHLVAFDRIHIGAGSMIGEYSSLRDANHRFGPDRALRHSGHTASPIMIGRNVWIGRGVTVLAGVCIGDNAVVGANAVVSKDVSAGAVVAGVPARVLHAGALS